MNWHSLVRTLFKPNRRGNIDPDEIFLDATNLPQFDESQFEGRIEKSLSKNTFFYFGIVVALIVLIFAGRIFFLQVTSGDEYARQSENNRLAHFLIFADRGIIYDRQDRELAWNTANIDEPFSKRIYYEDGGSAHLLGYVGYPLKDVYGNYYETDFIGKAGAELALNDVLGGENGLKIVETDARAVVHSEGTIRPPRSGDDVRLSIDSRVSSELYRLMEERAAESGFTGGAGVIMDVHTGEILALSSFPEYDPSVLSDGDIVDVQGYLGDERKPFLNRVISGLYTPGSIIKPFIAIGALEEEVITADKEILSTGALRLPNPYFPEQVNIFKDWKAHGLVDLRHALAVSSNVYFYEVGGGFEDQEGLGISRIEEYVRLFGFGEETGIKLSGEAIGTIPNPSWKEATFEDGVWRVGDTYHTAIGQYGFQVTPIQAVRAVAALANDGSLLTPTLVLGESIKKDRLPLKKKNLEIVREGMRLAVTEGTAQGISLPQVRVAAKTGTAELGVSKKFVNSWITGFFPYDEPRYAFVVLMEHGPRDNLIGALYVMRQLLEWMSVHTPEYITS